MILLVWYSKHFQMNEEDCGQSSDHVKAAFDNTDKPELTSAQKRNAAHSDYISPVSLLN